MLGIAIIVLLLIHYDPRQVLAPLLGSKIQLLLAVIALQAAIQLLNAATPVVLLPHSASSSLSWWDETRIFLAMQPLALVAPGRLSDIGAIPLLRKYHRTGAVASAIVLDRLITLFFLLIFTPLALRFVWPANVSAPNDVLVAMSLLLVISSPYLLTRQKVRQFVNRWVLRPWPDLLSGFGEHTEYLLTTVKLRLLSNFALTGLKTLLAGMSISLLAANFGVGLDVFTAIWMSVLIQLVTSVPLAPQGLGVAEGSLVLLFEFNGLPGATALSMGIVARALFLPVIAGIYLTTSVPLLAKRLAGGTSDAGAALAALGGPEEKE